MNRLQTIEKLENHVAELDKLSKMYYIEGANEHNSENDRTAAVARAGAYSIAKLAIDGIIKELKRDE